MNLERKLNRLAEYDYSAPGYYFVTINVHNREDVFGEITDGEMVLNNYGEIAQQCWIDIPEHIEHCMLDEYIIMPDHVHGIVIITDDGSPVGGRHACPLPEILPIPEKEELLQPVRNRHACSLPVVIGSYKSAVSKLIHCKGMKGFKWQRSYYDRIIRDQNELNALREYIRLNPERWRQRQEVGLYREQINR